MVGSLVSIKISCSYCARSEPVVSESCSLKSRDIFILTREPTICSIHVFCIFTLQIYILQNEANFSSLVGHFDAFVAAHGDKCSAFLHAGEGALADADGEGVLFVVPG